MNVHFPKNTPRVLILGEDTRSFLSTIRSFGRAGFRVDVGWVNFRSPALASRYIHEVVAIPRYHPETKDWLDKLNQLVCENDYEFVVGCHDTQLLPLQHHRHELGQPERFALIPDPAFAICFNKQLTYELADRLGVPVPEQRIAHSPADVLAAMQDWHADLYIKPVRSTNIDNVALRNTVSRVDYGTDVPEYDALTLAEGLLVQRAVSGRGVGVEVLAKNGNILTAFQHERVHEPPQGGGSSYRRSVPLDAGMLDASGKLIQAMDYTGVAMIEFKYDAPSGHWWLMEINGRFWGSMPLTVAAGLDMPLYWYQLLRQGREDFPQAYRHNLYCRDWYSDRYWFSENALARRQHFGNRLTLSKFRVLAEVRHILLGRERSDTWVLDDPKPALGELKQLVIEPIDKRLRQLGFMRRLAQTKAERAIVAAHSILFVCHGNICRSPFAEYVAQQLLDIPVASAGTLPMVGRPSPSEAIQVALQQGVDLSQHRSCVLDVDMLQAADVVLVFDLKNELNVLAQFPFAHAKLHQIAALDAGVMVEDPFGRGITAFEQTYALITRLVQRIGQLREK